MRKIKQVSNIVGKKTRTRADMYHGVRSFGHTAAQEHSGLWDFTSLSTAYSLFRSSFCKQHDNVFLHNKANNWYYSSGLGISHWECASHARGLTWTLGPKRPLRMLLPTDSDSVMSNKSYGCTLLYVVSSHNRTRTRGESSCKRTHDPGKLLPRAHLPCHSEGLLSSEWG